MTTDKWKRSLDDYVASASALFSSMVIMGFAKEDAIPVDPNGEILDGSHRVACACALGYDTAPVNWMPRFVWAPPWDLEWFVAHNMDKNDLDRLRSDWETMQQ